MYKNQLLDSFGCILMSEVRDEAIDKFIMISEGKFNTKEDMETTDRLANFDDNEKIFIRKIIIDSIDSTIHFFLFMLEHHEQNISLKYSTESGDVKHNIVEESDGLCGELYTEYGWIERFSKHKNRKTYS